MITTPLNLIGLRLAECCGSCKHRSGAHYENSRCNEHDIEVADYHVCGSYTAGDYIQTPEDALREAEEARARRARWDQEYGEDRG